METRRHREARKRSEFICLLNFFSVVTPVSEVCPKTRVFGPTSDTGVLCDFVLSAASRRFRSNSVVKKIVENR
jgi:hypothetical protein